MKDAHVTLHDVAARAGVSIATASRVLTGVKVRNKNKARVDQAAAELGYVPNEAARALRGDRTMTVGVVFNQLNGPLATELLDALASALDEKGYSLFVSTAQGQDDRFDTLVHRFLERRVDALLCVNAAGNGAALDRYLAAGIPVAAMFSKSGGYERLPLIAPSIVDAAHLCVARLTALGHHHIGVLRPTRRSPPIEAFRSVARQDGMSVRTYDVPEGPLDAVGVVSALINDAQRPTVLVAHQSTAVQLLETADQMSMIVPRMLSIVGIRDRAQQIAATRLPLSMIHLNPGHVGVVAARMLVARLAGEAELAGDTLVQMGAWIERDTTAAVR